MTAWLNTFYIGTVLSGAYADFRTLKSLMPNLDKPVDPNPEFFPFSASFDTGSGGRTGVGFPHASWAWQHRKNVQVEVLRNLCPGLSAQVYIRTRTNESVSGVYVWRTYLCQMLWMPESIDIQAGYNLGFTLEFRGMIVQAELT